jgi:drug/metabolite transporter (DMT)-like permease
MPRVVAAAGWPGVVSGAFLAGTFFFYIASLTRTTVANTNVLMSVSPFLAAIAARVLLKEAVPLRTWLAMALAFTGIVVMFADALDTGACRAISWRSASRVASPRRSRCCASSMRASTCCRRCWSRA